MRRKAKLGRKELQIWKDAFKEASADKDFKIFIHEPIEININQNNDYKRIYKRKVGA